MPGNDGHTTTGLLFGGSDPGKRVSRAGLLGMVLLPFAPVLALLKFGGFELGSTIHLLLDILILVTALVPVVAWISSLIRHPSKRRFLTDWAGSTVFLGIFGVAAVASWLRSGWGGVIAVAAVATVFHALHRGALLLLNMRFCQGRPAVALGLSFALVILLGALALYFAPAATQGAESLDFIDALFTATSATCVTGLESVSTAGTLSLFGQGVVLFLIQIGGLGIMTLGTFLLLTSGHRLGLSSRAVVSENLNVHGEQGMTRLLTAILGFTFFFEILGAMGFWFWFSGEENPVFASVFHSVSAFCNAGFALRSNSFGDFATDGAFNLIAVVLITAGGIGFTVLRELRHRIRDRLLGRMPRPLSLHTKLVLVTSSVLFVVGALGFYLLERNGVLAELGAGDSMIVSVFQSVSTRTAGFATVDFGGESGLSQATRFFLMPIMWIGASPGSTGGGLKTVTFAVLALGVWAQMRRRQHVEILGRRIPDDQGRQAGTIALLYGMVLITAVLALLISEADRFALNELLFEAVSAVATVGFSCGVSSSDQLSDIGKLVITVLMFVGRLGPLTLVFVLGKNRSHIPIEFPEERVMIG